MHPLALLAGAAGLYTLYSLWKRSQAVQAPLPKSGKLAILNGGRGLPDVEKTIGNTTAFRHVAGLEHQSPTIGNSVGAGGVAVLTGTASGDDWHTWLQWMIDHGYFDRDADNRVWYKHPTVSFANLPLSSETLSAGFTQLLNPNNWPTSKTSTNGLPAIFTYIDDSDTPLWLRKTEFFSRWGARV